MTLSVTEPGTGAPRTNRASKKGKKSWRKNVAMAEVEAALDEERFEERVGGSFAARPDAKLFIIEKEAAPAGPKRNWKEPQKLRCFANLEGLPGVPDPKPLRNRTKLPEERENPTVRAARQRKAAAGELGSTEVERRGNRASHLAERARGKEQRAQRRRTEFDFDMWGTEDKVPKGPSPEWVGEAARIHTAQGQAAYTPKAAAKRSFTTGSTLPAVEVPHSGASYNPSAAEHQDLMWKATMVQLEKEKEQARIERQTTAMFPARGHQPSAQDKIKEMSEGIIELAGEAKEEMEEAGEGEEEEEGGVGVKPKTRKQKRDKRGRMFEEQRAKRERDTKLRESEVMRSKSLRKELAREELRTKETQARRQREQAEKMAGPIQLSNYKYEPQEMEVKLPDELTGNLRNLTPEGSLLEDRFKSLQRRNLIEVRVKQKTVKRLKRKTFEKRAHKMGWEENKNVTAKRIRAEGKQRRRRKERTAQ